FCVSAPVKIGSQYPTPIFSSSPTISIDGKNCCLAISEPAKRNTVDKKVRSLLTTMPDASVSFPTHIASKSTANPIGRSRAVTHHGDILADSLVSGCSAMSGLDATGCPSMLGSQTVAGAVVNS